MLHSIGIFCLALVLCGEGTPLFGNVSVGSGIISEGNSVDLLCKVKNLTDDYSIYWYRTTKTGDRKAIYRDGTLINNNVLGREAEAYSFHSTSDVLIKQLRGRDLGRLLNGNNYTCEIISKRTGKAVLVSSGIILEARYPPSPLYPIFKACNFSSEFIGSSVTISCYSEPGVPRVRLQWTRNGEDIKNLQSTLTHSFVYVNYTFILEADDLGAIFQCIMYTQHGQAPRTRKLETDTLSNCDSAPKPTETPDDKTYSFTTTNPDEKSFSLIIITSISIPSIILLCVLCLSYILWKKVNRQKTNNDSGNDECIYEEPPQFQPCSSVCVANPEDEHFDATNITGGEVPQDGYSRSIIDERRRSAVENLYDLN